MDPTLCNKPRTGVGMTYQCAVCGEEFQPMVGHVCRMEAPATKNKATPEFLTLVDRLEKLSRENEFLRMQNDILKAKKEIKDV